MDPPVPLHAVPERPVGSRPPHAEPGWAPEARSDVPGGHGHGLRLAILGSRGIPARYGGFETFAQELATRLVIRGFDVTVFCPAQGSADEPRRASWRGVRLEHVPAPRIGPATSILFDARCLWRARRRFDVVYMLGYGASPFCFLPRAFGTDVWINMDGLEWRRSKWSAPAKAWLRACEWVATRSASHLVFDHGAVARDVCARTRPRTRHSVIPYGAPRVPEPAAQDAAADGELLARHGLEPGEYALMVTRMEPENQVLELLRAYRGARLRRPLAVVTHVDGASAYARAALACAGERVRILGPVYGQDELHVLRRNASAYVHGHTVGGTNPSLLEAMGSGCPIVAHDNRFNREVLRSCGRYFPSPGGLASALASLEAMPAAERQRLGARARRRARADYDWEVVVDRYASLLRSRAGRDGHGLLGDAAEPTEARRRVA